MMTPSARRSTAISRSSQSILRKAGLVITSAAFPLILRLPEYFVLCGSCSFDHPIVVPANAGTHTPCRLVVARGKVLLQQETLGVVGPGARAQLRTRPGRRGKLPWRHADGAVEADGFAVQHRVLDDVHREVAVFASI